MVSILVSIVSISGSLIVLMALKLVGFRVSRLAADPYSVCVQLVCSTACFSFVPGRSFSRSWEHRTQCLETRVLRQASVESFELRSSTGSFEFLPQHVSNSVLPAQPSAEIGHS